MIKFDYSCYPGKRLEQFDFEIDDKQHPIVSIITPYYNGYKYIEETFNCILNQTFPYWEWIIVDDGSNDQTSKEILNEIEKRDSRIKVFYKENEGAAAARDYGVLNSNENSKYILFLDSDDVLDKTYIECCYWALETNPKASWAYTDTVNFGERNFLWRKWYNPVWEQDENILTVTSLIKKEDFNLVNGFELREKKVYEDWCFWLKLIGKEKFPVRIGSLLTWYRIKKTEESELGQSNAQNKQRALKLVDDVKKGIVYTKDAIQYPRYTFKWNTLKEKQKNIIQVKRKKNNKINVLMIVPWMTTGGADKFNLDLMSKIDKNKYEFTMVTTFPNTNNWRQDFEKYATIYDLSTFLDMENWLSFINYLIEKNNIDVIFNTNSQFGYNCLPLIKAKYPQIPIIDYVHMEEWYIRNGGFSRDSSNVESVIDKTYTCNGNSKKVLEEYFGRNKNEIETVYIGVDEKKFDPELFNKEKILNEFKINKQDKYIISYICRIADQKRPFLFVECLKELKKVRQDFIILIAGDGPMLLEVKEKIKKYKLENDVVFLGNVKETEKIYAISDLTINTSIKEGLALTSYESLAMGVPVVSSDVGGQKELISEDVGVIVPCFQKEEEIWNYNYSEKEIKSYVDAIIKIINNLNKYKSNCRKRILNGFTIDNMIDKMDKEFDYISKNPNPEKKANGLGLQKNINIAKDYLSKYILMNEPEYSWAANKFNQENVHIILKYDKKARKEQFYEHTLEYKIKHPIVVLLRKIGIYDKLKKIIGWDKR